MCAFFCALPFIAGATGEILTANTSLNLRSGPGTRHTSLLVLKSGEEMTKTGSSGDWYRVSYGKRTGFVRKNLVTVKGASTAPTTSTEAAAGDAKPAAYRTLREGMSGEDVRLLQEGLSNAGFMDTKPDGRFGPATKRAVTAYQKANKLKADGIAGEATQRKLLGDPAAPNTGAPAATPAENPSATNAPLVFAEPPPGSALRLGNKGEAVRTLQTQLQTLGYLSGRVDGSFGLVTEQAVMAFQRASRLKADGVAGNATQNAISAALTKRNAPVDVPATATANANANTSAVLKEGSKNDTVRQMQTTLKNLGYFGGTVTGNFGPLTAEAVKAFQKANSLKADGVAGPATLTKLFSESAVANGKSGSSSSVSAAGSGPSAASVQHIGASTIRSRYKNGTVVTIYCFRTKLTWKCRFYSVGVHADAEPLTKTDTDTMFRAFGNRNTWTPKAVWVTMPDGKTYIASMHNMGHLSGSIKDNGFNGHLCIHFPRTMNDAQNTGSYAVTHQEEIIRGWAETQAMAGR